MNTQFLMTKFAEVEKIVESLPEEYKREARIAVLTKLLLTEKPIGITSDVQLSFSSRASTSNISSMRQLSRITKKNGITGDRVVVALGCFLEQTECRSLTPDDCRENWDILCQKSFATNWILNAEAKGWLQPAKENGKRNWKVTSKGYEEFVKMQSRISEKENEEPELST